MDESKKKVLEHQLEEWKYLNEYVNQMDMNYQHSYTIMISIFAGTLLLFTSEIGTDLVMGIFIIPPGIIAVFAYLSYQFRITAILRGHLGMLEQKMNRLLRENVHMWNSALVETFMAHNNSINRYMMLPNFVFVFIIIIYSLIFTWKASQQMEYGIYVLCMYWLLMLICGFIVIVPFFKNENVRRETANHERVWKMYKKYLDEIKHKKKFIYEGTKMFK